MFIVLCHNPLHPLPTHLMRFEKKLFKSWGSRTRDFPILTCTTLLFPVDGGWTVWQNWGECNIACGPVSISYQLFRKDRPIYNRKKHFFFICKRVQLLGTFAVKLIILGRDPSSSEVLHKSVSDAWRKRMFWNRWRKGSLSSIASLPKYDIIIYFENLERVFH